MSDVSVVQPTGFTLGIFVLINFDMHQERTEKASDSRQKVTCRHLLSLLWAAGAEELKALLTDKPAENKAAPQKLSTSTSNLPFILLLNHGY